MGEKWEKTMIFGQLASAAMLFAKFILAQENHIWTSVRLFSNSQ